MRGIAGADLLRLPVRQHGIELGRPVDLVLDRDARRVLGLELVCGDRANRFLALGAATVGEHEIAVDSALAVLDDAAFYRKRGHALRDLRGASVTRDGTEVGKLADVVVTPGGELPELVLADGARMPLDDRVRIAA
jgi:sporulation protein YlmC with PRC-barrel domain